MSKTGYLRTPLRALLAFVVAAGLLTIALPFHEHSASRASTFASISTISDVYALLPATYTTSSKLSAVRLSKKNHRGIGIGHNHASSYFASFGDSVPGVGQFRSTSGFRGILKKIYIQACLFQDLPPPSA